MKNSVAFYLRVSTEEQKNGFGLDVQLDKLKAFASLHDLELKPEHLFSDEGFSGTLSVEKRPGLSKLMECAKKHEFSTVAVYKVDRLGRDNLIVISTVKQLTELGIDFKSATEPFDTSNTFGNFMLQFLGGFAEMDRKNIVERTHNGRMMAARQGKWVLGTPAYGYRINHETDKLEIVPEEQKWVVTFFKWLVDEKCSLSEIARRANRLAIPTKLTNNKSPRKSTGIWWERTIGRLLTNEVYTGTIFIRKFKKPIKSFKDSLDPSNLRDRSDWIEYKVPQIIDLKTLNAAITQLKQNSERAKRNTKRNYLFQGILHCSKCGFKLRAMYNTPSSKSAKGSVSYTGYTPLNERERSAKCGYCGNIAESRLLTIWNAIEKIIDDPKVITDKMVELSVLKKEGLNLDNRSSLNEKLNRLISKEKRLTTSFIDFGMISDRDFKTEMAKLRNERIDLEKKIEKLNDVHSAIQTPKNGDLLAEIKRIQTLIKSADSSKKQKIMKLLIDKVTLDLQKNTAKIALFIKSPYLLQDNRCCRTTR